VLFIHIEKELGLGSEDALRSDPRSVGGSRGASRAAKWHF